MRISVEINSQVKVPLDSLRSLGALFRQAARLTAVKAKLKKNLSVSVGLVGEGTMKKINFRYRHKNKPTDVLSFGEVNEIVICLPQALKQSKTAKHFLERELTFLFVHGLLHLLGYEDETWCGYEFMLKLGQEITQKALKRMVQPLPLLS